MAVVACGGRTSSVDYREVLANAALDTVDTPAFRMDGIDLGSGNLGGDTLRATFRNRTDEEVSIGLDLRADAGFWFGARHRRYALTVQPGDSAGVALPYGFRVATPEDRLEVTVGGAVRRGDTIVLVDTVFRKSYALGAGNPFVRDPARDFARFDDPPFELWAWRGSLAERNERQILKRRLDAMHHILGWIDAPAPKRIRLVFYSDGVTKQRQTGHAGLGEGSDSTLVEVLNDSVHLDPYHELTHVLTHPLGSPPSFLDEGFAVYVAERLGADALKYLGAPGEGVDQRTCGLSDAERFPLRQLVGLNIGSPGSRAFVSYPESASLVKYLIEAYGLKRFRQAFRTLKAAPDVAGQQANIRRLEAIYGVPLDTLERSWLRVTCYRDVDTTGS